MMRAARIVAWTTGVAVAGLLVFGLANYEPDRPMQELAARWASPPSMFVAMNGMQVHVRDEGPRNAATTIVLLHGTGSSLHTWDGWAAGLRNDYRVLRADLPGFGLTGPSPGDDYSMRSYARFVEALLDWADVDRAVLAGNSLGGHIAWVTALTAPARVEGLVLVDASGYPIDAESNPIGFTIASTPILRDLVRNVLPRFVVEQSIVNVYGDPDRIEPGVVERYFELTLRAGNRDALIRRLEQFEPAAMSERVTELEQPTLLIWGAQDRLVPLAVGERFDEDIPDSTLVVFDDLGHVPHEEAPERTVAVVRGWLDEQSAGPRSMDSGQPLSGSGAVRRASGNRGQ